MHASAGVPFAGILSGTRACDKSVSKADEGTMRNLTVNGERLWASLMELARIGATEKGGVCRLAGTDLDAEARRLFIRWCEEAGCTVTVDRIGNIFARRAGRDPNLPPVVTGRPVDTQ